MEKAVFKTLVYSDIFDFPLSLSELHRWLIGKESSIENVEKTVFKMVKNKKIVQKNGLYFLLRRSEICQMRMEREEHSVNLGRAAEWVARIFKIVPWVKLVGISGSVAVRNADTESDIDLFVITQDKRLWISRICLVFILEFLGKRRQREDSIQKGKGKICLNLLLTESELVQQKKDLYVAHEVLQTKVLWDRDGMYQRFLEANDWVYSLLPNWIGYASAERGSLYKKKKVKSEDNVILDMMEKILAFLQRRYMGKLTGDEKIDNGALFFHPHDLGGEILEKYQSKVKKYLHSAR